MELTSVYQINLRIQHGSKSFSIIFFTRFMIDQKYLYSERIRLNYTFQCELKALQFDNEIILYRFLKINFTNAREYPSKVHAPTYMYINTNKKIQILFFANSSCAALKYSKNNKVSMFYQNLPISITILNIVLLVSSCK